MNTVTVLFGTESGNAEMVADDLQAALEADGFSPQLVAMEDYDVSELATAGFAIMITSTYGEGELPATTAPFHDALLAAQPDLSDLRFAAFGLGDSTYENYNNGIEILRGTVSNLGAQQVGETGKHDAASGSDPCGVATDWVSELFAQALAA